MLQILDDRQRQHKLLFGNTLIALLAVLLISSLAHSAQSPTLGRAMKAQDAKSGTLLVRTSDHDQFRPMPTLAMDVDIKVTGMVGRTIFTQHFGNPTDQWLEGVYVFPLPETAAVDTLIMKIGERVIVGEIEEKEKAKKIYKEAKKAGKKASLLEQERPNIFTTSVANIGPGEIVSIVIEFQEDYRYDQGEFSLRFPMVVGPRYIPGIDTVYGFSDSGWANNTDQVPDASRITPPVADPNDGPINPVRVRVHIDTGFPISVKSPSHSITATQDTSGTLIELTETSVPADSDFILEWRPLVGNAPGAALFSDVFKGETYALLMLMPPSEKDTVIERLPRETIFVIDTSGSMDGDSIRQAKEALRLALLQLTPEDSFNVIRFSDQAHQLFSSSEPATQQNINQAVRYVQGLTANGGTEMLEALRLAIGRIGDLGKVRQVIFITDGAVANETNLFSFIKRNLGRSRLFTVGIGSAPNSYFMRKAAEFGKGTFTYIGYASEVQNKMGELFSKLESPVLSEIVVDWHGNKVEHWPEKIPDLYLGEPIVITAKLPKLGTEVSVVGWRGSNPFAIDFKLEGGSTHSGIDRLFARRKIDALTSSLAGDADADAVRTQIVALGLNHHLVTKYTSLVAVEKVASRPKDESVKSSEVPTNLPKGWVLDNVFGQIADKVKMMREALQKDREKDRVFEEARKSAVEIQIAELQRAEEAVAKAAQASSSAASYSTAMSSADSAPAPTAEASTESGVSSTATTTKRVTTSQGPGVLPQTATAASLFLLVGLLLLTLAFFFRSRRRIHA